MKEDPVKRTVSRFVSAFPLALVALALAVSPAFAHHPTGSATASCDGYDVSGSYVGGSSYRWLDWNVTVTIDGVPEVIADSWNGVSPGFEIFSRTGSGPHDVVVTGYIKMFDNVHTNAVSADTDTGTFDEDHSSNSGFNAGVNFFDSDKQVTITADAGYSITSVGIDYTGSPANEVTLGAQASPFTYDAPGSETIDNITITIFRPATPATDVKGALLNTFTYNLNFVGECYETCDETIPGDVVYGPVVDVGAPVWGSWVDNGDGTFTSTGTQATTQHWTQDIVDARDGSLCSTDEGDISGSRPVTKTADGSDYLIPTNSCEKGWSEQKIFLDPDGFPVGNEYDSGLWTDPYEPEQATSIFGTVFNKPEDCQQDRPTSVSADVGVCSWDGEVSTTEVAFTLGEGVTVLLSGPNGSQSFTESTTLNLPPGDYSWSAVADEGYVIEGPAEGQFAVGSCEPGVALVSATFGVCKFENGTSIAEVTFTLSGDVTVTLTGPNGFEMVLTETTTLELLDGHYEWTAEAGEGSEMEGEDSGAFDLNRCEPREQPRCPTCGAPIKETAGESMAIAWFSDKPCDPNSPLCWYDYRDTVGGWVKLWTQIESSVTRKGTTTELTEILAANSETWYLRFFRDPHSEGDFILWGPGGYGDRFRDHVPNSERALHKYSACSIFPSWADTRLVDGQGYALWLPGHNTSDWAQFLLDNGFFPDEQFRGTAALKWAAELRENGNEALFNWDGDLESLPLFPLPPR